MQTKELDYNRIEIIFNLLEKALEDKNSNSIAIQRISEGESPKNALESTTPPVHLLTEIYDTLYFQKLGATFHRTCWNIASTLPAILTTCDYL